MKKWSSILSVAGVSGLLLASGLAFAYDSGSTGADGAFNPTQSKSIQLPPDGIFNYTSVNIPSGVTITYIKNAANTPVTIFASGDVTIAGTLDVSAKQPAYNSGPGLGGPGGYDGGRGGQPGGDISAWVNGYGGPNVGGAGVGPGGGGPGQVRIPASTFFINNGYGSGYAEVVAGGGGAYGFAPPAAGGQCSTTPGVAYGNAALIPLVGGSGGGGGAGGPVLPGSGGGGGGGAILIATSGTLNVSGSILAKGGSPTYPGSNGNGRGAYGGGGSGGAIRLIATKLTGEGTINADGGTAPGEIFTSTTYGQYAICSTYGNGSQNGGTGRIRIEAESIVRNAAIPLGWIGTPSLAFVPGLPTLRIDSIGGIAVPAQPTGSGDVTLPAAFANPVTVTFVTTGVTVGSSVKLSVIPPQGTTVSVTSSPTTGTTNNATASASVNLLAGANTLQASVTYTVVASVGDAMSVYAQGERVEKVTLVSTLGGKESPVTLTTVSGKEYKVPASALAKSPG